MVRLVTLLFGYLCLTFSGTGAIVFPSDTSWKFLPGYSEASPDDPTAWRLPGFDDFSWAFDQAPFYYDNQPTSATAYTGNTELTDMLGNYTCIFLRKTFTIENPNDVEFLQMVSFSDDGFIAWINGAEVARFNMPAGEIPFNGSSLPALSEPVPIQTNVITQANSPLVAGENVIAVQAFNASLSGSSDFVFSMEMSSSVDDTPPSIASLIPPANAIVQQLTQIEVFFSEGVEGVDATDLLINGQPASAVTPYNESQYVFEFPQPANGQVVVSWRPDHGIHDLSTAANPFVGGTWTYTFDPNSSPPGLVISEFMAENKKTLRDEDGDSSDWIELFNGGNTTVSLAGYYLTVQSNVLQWRFPSVAVLPNHYQVVFASGKDRTNIAGVLHTNFKLDKAGGYLALLDPTGKAVSAFPSYPVQYQDVAYGREPNNPALVGYFPQPTPGAANKPGGPGFSPGVLFSQSGGVFTNVLNLDLSTASSGATIYYTLDGSIPTQTSQVYSGPIAITNSVQVRAISYTPGLLPGPSRSETYLALAPTALGFSSDLPVMVLYNFKGGRVPAGSRQFANVSVFEPGYGRTSLTNQPTLSTRAGINIRGSSTLGQVKSNFRVEFWDEQNNGDNHPLLGMPSDNDWILYACDNFEPVLIHNKFMHDLSRQVGRYSPRARFVEVYLNTAGGPITPANYNGVYVLLEKIKIGTDRVDIPKLQPENSTPPSVTGGYLMSIDRSASGEGQLYSGGLGINTLDPGDEIYQPERQSQYQFISNYLDEFYSVLNSPSFADPVNGYVKYVDVDSAIDHHILNILAFNVDALRLSAYFYKPRDGKLSFGPLWDFDRALGSTDGRDANPRIWRSTSSDRGTDMFNSDPSIFSNPWFSQMFRDIDFWQRWIDRWQELRRTQFALTNLHGLVDSLANEVREAEKREIARWPGFTTPRGSYQSEVDRMKTWLSNRVDFIDTNFVAAPMLSRAGGPIATGGTITLTGPTGATIYYTLNGTDPRASGGAIRSGALPYGGPISLSANARVVARALDPNHHNLTGANKPPLSSSWSGPVAATYVVATPTLAITELMYHPVAAPPGSTNTAEDYEYLELKNVGTEPVSLLGMTFTQGIDFTFTSGGGVTTLAPGAYVLIVKNRVAFSSRYPGVTNIAGEYSGSLDNAGERITLQGALQEPILDFTYSNDWFVTTAGLGFSLVAADERAPGSQASLPGYWRVSVSPGGSPGQVDPPPPSIPSVLINEALTHTDLPELDAVELFNPTATPAPIGGWFLSDDRHDPMKYQIPPGTELPAGGFKVFDASAFDSGPRAFALSSLGEEVYLFSAAGTNLTGYAHGFSYGAAAHGVSFGRYVTSTGDEKFVAQSSNTLGGINAGPKVGPLVVSEIMYDPLPLGTNNNTRDEYIELYNVSGQSIPLFDPAAPTNTWRITGGVQFEFPSNVTLAAGQTLLVVNFDPQVDTVARDGFSDQYILDLSNVVLFGPYQGNLNNGGDHIALYKPDPPEPANSPKPGFVPYVLVDEVHYGNQPPWPVGVNGTGQSLERVNLLAFADDPNNWRAGPASPGQVAVNPGGLEVASIRVQAGQCVLTFEAVAGESYSVLYRDSLSSGAGWLKLQDVPPQPTTQMISVTDATIGGTASARYYLLVTPASQ